MTVESLGFPLTRWACVKQGVSACCFRTTDTGDVCRLVELVQYLYGALSLAALHCVRKELAVVCHPCGFRMLSCVWLCRGSCQLSLLSSAVACVIGFMGQGWASAGVKALLVSLRSFYASYVMSGQCCNRQRLAHTSAAWPPLPKHNHARGGRVQRSLSCETVICQTVP